MASITTDGPDFVPPEERIAVFDNDGTLWSEKPIPIQLDFALYRMAADGERRPGASRAAALEGGVREGHEVARARRWSSTITATTGT